MMKHHVLALLTCVSFAIAASQKPNVLFLYTDDQGPWTIGANGYEDAHTPNLDRLFNEGANLVNAMVNSPVCSPSRASLMTSRYGSELMITEWIHRKNSGLDPELPVWPRILQKAGYRTGLVGKWHLGYPDKHYPTNFGFDYFMGMRAGGITPKNPKLEKDKTVKPYQGLTEDIFTNEAIAFIKRNREIPFALCVHYRAPHTAWLPVAPEDLAPHKGKDFKVPHPDVPGLNVKKLKKALHDYAASVTCIDRNVGRILETIDELKLKDDTIVIFTSDHGYNVGHRGLWSKGNSQHTYHPAPKQIHPGVPSKQRPNLFDTSMRVPTAVRWPGKIPAARHTEVINNMDWFPTILAMVDVPLPKTAQIHGRNALPILTGQKTTWDNTHYAEYDMRIGAQVQMRAIRTEEWKLMIDYLNPGRKELYDLKNDPDERTNLYPPISERATTAFQNLSKQLTKKIKAVNAHPADTPYGFSINFGASNLGAVSPGKRVGKHKLAFTNNLLKMRGAIKLNAIKGLRDSLGEQTAVSIHMSPSGYATGNNSFNNWQQVFMHESAQFKEPIRIKNLPDALTQGGYNLTLYSAAAVDAPIKINGKTHNVSLAGDFTGTYSSRNSVTIEKLSSENLTIDLPPTFKLSGIQLIAH